MSATTLRHLQHPTLSAAAQERLERELAALLEERTLRATEPIDATGDAADLAEFAARDMLLERLDARMADISGLLAEASVTVVHGARGEGEAGPGALVDLRFGSGNAIETFVLGHLAEAGDGLDVVTTDSPLGRALVGAKAGSTVRYGAPRGDVAVTVVGVRAA